MLFSSLLSQVDFKRVTILTFGTTILMLYAYIHQQSVNLKEAQLVYLHPKTIIKTLTRIERGPVRIVTRIVERPTGERETTIDETHGSVIETTATSTETAPVALSVALASPRADRYLLTLGVNRLTADVDGKALFVGYGFKNRLDVQVGGIVRDGFSPWILTTLRF